MKKLSCLIVLFFATMMAYAQCNIPAKIVDPDGYVNVRQSPNSKSAVLRTLSSGTKVYYEYEPSYNGWCRIANTSAGSSIGYIHSSRLSDIWTMDACIHDTDGAYTNLRKSPGGDVAKKLPTNNMYILSLSEYKNGWWLIESLTEFAEYDEIAMPLPQGGYWIHISCIGLEISGDGNATFSLYAKPKKGANVIKTYSNAGMGITSVLDMSADKKYLKVKLSDSRTGWILREKTCYNPYTTCE